MKKLSILLVLCSMCIMLMLNSSPICGDGNPYGSGTQEDPYSFSWYKENYPSICQITETYDTHEMSYYTDNFGGDIFMGTKASVSYELTLDWKDTFVDDEWWYFDVTVDKTISPDYQLGIYEESFDLIKDGITYGTVYRQTPGRFLFHFNENALIGTNYHFYFGDEILFADQAAKFDAEALMLEVKKVDALTSKPLSNVKFDIFEENETEPVWSGKTNEDGVLLVEHTDDFYLNMSVIKPEVHITKYRLKEYLPNGYTGDDEWWFVFSANDDVTQYIEENYPDLNIRIFTRDDIKAYITEGKHMWEIENEPKKQIPHTSVETSNNEGQLFLTISIILCICLVRFKKHQIL